MSLQSAHFLDQHLNAIDYTCMMESPLARQPQGPKTLIDHLVEKKAPGEPMDCWHCCIVGTSVASVE